MESQLALIINKFVHERCKDVPHDIGWHVLQLVVAFENTNNISISEKYRKEIERYKNMGSERKCNHLDSLNKNYPICETCNKHLL